MIATIAAILAAYLLGSIPSGLLLGKYFGGVDLRTVGSHNIGATNAYRILGAKVGAAVFLCDLLKGVIGTSLGGADPYLVIACGAAALLGHIRSLFLGFHGGRGVATGLGVLLCLSWPAALMALAVWGLLMRWKGIVSLASMLAALSAPLAAWLFGAPTVYCLFILVGAVAIVVKHKDNIGRLMRGEEKPIRTQKR